MINIGASISKIIPGVNKKPGRPKLSIQPTVPSSFPNLLNPLNRNTPEITNKTYVNFYVIFIPLLLIWFSGFFYLINYFMYGNH